MHKLTAKSVVCLLLAMIAGAVYAQSGAQTPEVTRPWWDSSVWENPDRDYKWYPPDPPKPAPPKKIIPPQAPQIKAIKKPTIPSEFDSTKDVAAELNRLKDQAVLHPTEPNVKAFLAFQQLVMEQGSLYADVVRRVVWTTPELDYQQRRPTNNTAILGYDQRRRETERMTTAQLAQQHGLFFFFKGDCPYCHQMAPLLRSFAAQTGMDVMAISLDGSVLPEFPGARPNNGLAEQLNITTVPATFLVSKDSRNIQAIAYGMVAQADLLERIYVLTQTKPGQDF
jgi:conjugal transfer pilus assembly protein TraF